MTEAQVALVESHLWLVHDVARYFIGRLPDQALNRGRTDLDELVADGYLGLVRAALRFNPDRGFQFKTYAHIRVLGAMRDGLRRDGLVMRRGVRQRVWLSWRDSQWYTARDQALSPYELYEQKQTRDRIARAAALLAPRDREVLMGFMDGETHVSIGSRMGFSTRHQACARVSQIQKRALQHMSEYLQ